MLLGALRSKRLDTARQFRLFACACVRRAWDLLSAERWRVAVAACERFADGLATREELAQRHDEAKKALRKKGLTEAARYAGAAAMMACLPDAHRSAIEAPHRSAEALARHADPKPRWSVDSPVYPEERAVQAGLLRDIFGNPF